MTRGDGPLEEPRAEIIEVSHGRIARSDERRAGAGRGGSRGAAGARLTRRQAVAAAAGLGLLTGLAVLISQANLLAAPGPHVSPAPSSIFPATAAGLPVITVRAASLKELDQSVGAAEVAVGGWYSELRNEETCYPAGQPGIPCPPALHSRLASSATPAFAPDGTELSPPPDASALQPVFVDPINPPDLPPGPRVGNRQVVAPTALVLIGHFHDDRAAACPAGTAQALACDPAFVVDAVADLAGVVRTDARTTYGGATRLTSAAVVSTIRGHVQPGGFILEFGPVPWFADPSRFSVVESQGDSPPGVGPTVWLARGYLAGAASWLAIDDATGLMWGPLWLAAPVDVLPVGFPRMIEGLQVRSVAGALGGVPHCCGLVAIGGFLSSDRAPEGCPPWRTSGKPNPCNDTHLALLDQRVSILQANDQTFLYDLVIPPGAAVIRPLIPPGTTAPDPWAGLPGLATKVEPRAVILVGQFGDPRSPECAQRPGGGNAGCDRSFVVDQVAWSDGQAEGPSIWAGPGNTPMHTADQVARVAADWTNFRSTPTIVSMTATAPADSVGLTGTSALERRGPGLVWIVRLVGNPSSSMPGSGYLVVDDGTLAVVGLAWLAFVSP